VFLLKVINAENRTTPTPLKFTEYEAKGVYLSKTEKKKDK